MWTVNTYEHNQYFDQSSWELAKFKLEQAQQTNDHDEAYLEILGPDDDPDTVCCLFDNKDFKGKVICFGVGAAHLPTQWVNLAQSVVCQNHGEVYLYDENLGHRGNQLIPGEARDLSAIPYGKKHDAWDNEVDTIWVRKALGV